MFTTNYGGVPDAVTPENDEGIVTGQGNNPQKDSNNDGDYRKHGPIQQAPDGKAIATQIARLALAGHTVHKGTHGDYTVCKYGLTRYCADYAALVAFAQKVGAA